MIHVGPALIPPRPVPAAEPADAPPSARALIEDQLAMLSRLAQIGMDIAEACGREAAANAEAGESAAPSPEHRRDPGLAFARVARAVRMTIALQSRLMKDLAELDRADARAERSRKDDRRIRLSRLARQAAEAAVCARRDALDPAEAWARSDDEDAVEDEIEQLSHEAYERLTDAEDGHLMGLSFDEAVAEICKDLGVSPDWAARLHAAVAPPPDPHGDAPCPACSGVAEGATRPGHAVAHPPDPAPPPPPPPLPRPEGGLDRRPPDI